VKAVSPSSAAKSLGTVLVDVSNDKATATVHPVDGLYDGEKITVSLVKEDGTWKVDSLKSNAPVGP
jgi:ribonuclease PH